MPLIKHRWSFFALLVITVLACLPLLIHGPQTGADFHLQLPWSYHFSQQFLNGELYPRWLSGMNAGAGAPTFFFYGPVAFHLTALTSAIMPESLAAAQLGAGQFLGVFLSSLTFYLFASRHCKPVAAIAGALFYALAPYHFSIDILFRQAFTESTAYIWLPLTLLFIDRMRTNRRYSAGLAISYALLVMTHIPTALLASPFILLYVLCQEKTTDSLTFLLHFAVSIVVGLLISCCYIIPALGLQEFIQARLWWTPYFNYQNWLFLDGKPFPNKELEALLTPIVSAYTALFALASLVILWPGRARKFRLWFAMATFFAGGWFLMTPLSKLVWDWIPLLQKVQFPWRAIVILDLAVAVAISLMVARAAKDRDSPFMVAVACIILSSVVCWVVWSLWQAYQPHRELWVKPDSEAHLQAQAIYGTGARPHIPNFVKLDRNKFITTLPSDRVRLKDPQGIVEIISWEPRSIELEVTTKVASILMVKQIAFPGWRARSTAAGTVNLTPHNPSGLILIDLPPGQQKVSLELAPLWHEKLGWGATVLGLLLLPVLLSRVVKSPAKGFS
jgi:hypothetical protein